MKAKGQSMKNKFWLCYLFFTIHSLMGSNAAGEVLIKDEIRNRAGTLKTDETQTRLQVMQEEIASAVNNYQSKPT